MKTKRSLLLLTALSFMIPAAAFPADKAGDIVYLKGKAEILRQATTLTATLKAPLEETDNVVTKERSRAKLLFRDDSILTLGANSKLFVKKYLQSPESKRAESIYELADGKLKAVVGGGGFQVKTPTAFAAARGTVFAIWYDKGSNITWVAVTEGEVEIKSSKDGVEGVLTLTAGQASSVPADGPPGPAQPFNLGSGQLAGELAELNETSAPTVVLPLEILRGADVMSVERPKNANTIPLIDQQPVFGGATQVTAGMIFPSSPVNIRVVFP